MTTATAETTAPSAPPEVGHPDDPTPRAGPAPATDAATDAATDDRRAPDLTPAVGELVELLRQADLLTPMVLRAAATLGLPDLVAEGVADVPTLAERTATDPHVLGPVVDHLVALEVLAHDGDRLTVTARGRLLTAQAPGGARRILDLDDAVGRGEFALTGLLDTLRTGRPAYELQHGRGYWQDVDADPELAASMAGTRPVDAGFDADLLLEHLALDDVRHVIDVGGGNGALLATLLRSAPHLTGTVVDLPRVVADAPATFRHHRVEDRGRAVGGSFFDALPADGDLYLLSGILFDWDDDDALRILRRVADAAAPDAEVVLSEISLDGWGQRSEPSLALRTRTVVSGRERSPAAIAGLAHRAGLTLVAEVPPTEQRSLQRFRVG